MPRDLILGTAGHIDHGKTTLVKALTGIDCDRLPEEKERGITIDIGFAHLQLGNIRLGIVDVPGHERFIRNMLAGASGIDLALLIVAADDGIMPQSREHLDILRLLGLRHGLVALTKCDLVDDSVRELRMLEIREWLADSFLADAPIVPTSTRTGAGLPELRQHLETIANTIETKQAGEWFRLCIDRAFIVQGHGTVVTGSVVSGAVKVGEELELLPSKTRVRVRSLNRHSETVERIESGQRGAINLPGIELGSLHRGQELATPGVLQPATIITARILVPISASRPLKHRLPVRLHIGTMETMATLTLLNCESIAPGEEAIGQLFTEEPICAVWGQPFVLRDSSAEHTIGGGMVLQPVASKIRRRQIEAIERVEKLASGNAETRIDTVAWLRGFQGMTALDLVRTAGVTLAEATQHLHSSRFPQLGGLHFHADRLQDIQSHIRAVLQQAHTNEPQLANHDRSRIESQLAFIGQPSIVRQLIDQLISNRAIKADRGRIALAEFQPNLSANQRKLKQKLLADFQTAGIEPPELAQYRHEPGAQGTGIQDLVRICVLEGHLVPIHEEMYMHRTAVDQILSILNQHWNDDRGVTVAQVRDWLGTTRKYAVPICEYLDRAGYTRREGDLRYRLPPLSTHQGG